MGQAPEALRADIEARREHMTETIDAIGDRVTPSRIAQRRVDRAKTWVGGVREKVMGSNEAPAYTGVAASSGSASNGPLGEVKEGAHHLAESVGDMPASVARQAGGNPLIAGALAFGMGALVASLLPETDSEHAAVEQFAPQIQAATDAVKDAGQHTVETAKGSAQGSVSDLKDSVAEKAQAVKAEATQAASEVKDEAKSAAAGDPPAPQR